MGMPRDAHGGWGRQPKTKSDMTQNKRIFLNIVATYGRYVLGAACGIFSTRWVLMALGQEDFGLYGLIGGIVIFMTFFNIQFAGALSRYYAYAVGQANVSGEPLAALEECRKWFSTGVTIHTVLPLLLVSFGYPAGMWAVESGVIGVPAARMAACVWLWRFACLTAFVSMASVPFAAMYTAKQYIAELTLYSLAQTILKMAFAFYMTLKPGDWLVRYGLAMSLVAMIPELLICLRAVCIFPECRLRLKYLALWPYMRQLGSNAGWQTFSGLGVIARMQFMTIIVNRFFGPRVTAAYSVGNTVAAESAVLNGALQGAFAPALTTAMGEGNLPRARMMVYQTCKYGTLLTLLFAVPMGLEIQELLRVWLKDVPPHAEGICLAMLAQTALRATLGGFLIGINASGRVARFQTIYGFVYLLTIPCALFAVLVWRQVYAVLVVLLAMTGVSVFVSAWVARPVLGTSLRHWAVSIIVPLALVAAGACLAGGLVLLFIEPSFLRLLLTSAVSVSVLLLASWRWVLTADEKMFVGARIRRLLGKVGMRRANR